jgi:hypothetical protein
MKLHSVLATLLLVGSSVAQALDQSDAGMYNVVRRDGTVANMTFMVAFIENRWSVLRQKPGNSWEDVTCEGDCVLRESKDSDLSRFFNAQDLSELALSCIHNKAFAFCRYDWKTAARPRGYVFVSLIESSPLHIQVARVR